MPGQLFGIPNGLRAYQEDQLALSDMALRKQEAKSNQAFRAAQIKHQEALAGRAAQEGESAATMQKLMQGIAAQGAQGQSERPAAEGAQNPLAAFQGADKVLATGWKQVEALQALGQVEAAGKLAREISGAGENVAQQRAAAASAEATKQRQLAAKHEFVTQVLSGVRDPASHAQALMILQSNPITANDPIPKQLQTYDQRVVDAMLAGSKAAKEKADLAREAGRAASQNANDASLRAARIEQTKLSRRRAQLAEEREDRLAKAGGGTTDKLGKPIAPPTKAEIQMVKNLAGSLGVEINSDDAAFFHESMAEQVKTLITANPALSRSEAAMRVLAEAKDRGELVSSRMPWGSPSYKPQEGSVTMPMPLPNSRAELKVGMYYRHPTTGKVEKYTGKGGK
jgi:hypothetical protein